MFKNKWAFFILIVVLSIGPWRPAAADSPSWLQAICSNVDCLNNFTGKAGWSIIQKQAITGGFTDLKTDWYVSPGPGFDAPIHSGPALGTPFLDMNAIFKIGKLASDKLPALKTFVNQEPFVSGLLGSMTIGESIAYDYTEGKWVDSSWFGIYQKFGPATPEPTDTASPIPATSKLNIYPTTSLALL